MTDRWKERIVSYLKGLGLTFLALLIGAAMSWFDVDATFTLSHIVVPLAMAFVIWTAMYLLSTLVWVLLVLITPFTMGMGTLLGLGFLGAIALKLAAYLLPAGWMAISDEPISLFLVGFALTLVDLVAENRKRDEFFTAVGKAIEGADGSKKATKHK